MARQSFKVEGLKDLETALLDLPKATARNVMLRTLKEQGAPIRDAGEANAPKLSGKLKLSYAISTKLSRRQKSLNKKQSPVEVYIGPGPHPKGVQTEFGNAHQRAEPHLRPAFDAKVRLVLDGIKVSLAGQIEKARARLARKAERLAAKIAAGQ